jgi:hypothetical protein
MSAHSVAQNMKNASRKLCPTSDSEMKATRCALIRDVSDEGARSIRAGSRANQSCDRRRGFGNLLLGNRAALSERFGDAMAQVVIEERERYRLKRLRRCRDLSEHVDAIRVFFDHALQATDLTLDPA